MEYFIMEHEPSYMERLVRKSLDYNILCRKLAIDANLRAIHLPNDINNLIGDYAELADELLYHLYDCSCKYDCPIYIGTEHYVSEMTFIGNESFKPSNYKSTMEEYSLYVKWTLSSYDNDELIARFYSKDINLDIIFAAITTCDIRPLIDCILSGVEDTSFHNSLNKNQRKVLNGSKMDALVTSLQLFVNYMIW